jgi:type VII secretion protein EccB
VQSRRDQIQAYSFIRGRLNSGVLRVDLDNPDQPVARTSRGLATGAVLALLAGALVAVYGFVVPGGNTGWRTSGTFVIARDSGARFLYAGGELRPVLNQTSAKLVAGSRMTVRTVDSASLRGAPRGAPFGIVGAPDALPGAGSLSGAAWSACVVPPGRGSDPAAVPPVVLRVGMPAAGTGLTAGQAVLTTVQGGARYLLWHGRRLTVGTQHGESQALGYGAITPVTVSAAFLDSVPAGPDLVTPQLAGIGTAGPELAGRPSRIGQLFGDASGRDYLLTGEGLAPLTPTLFALFRGDPTVQSKAYAGAAVTAREIGPNDLAAHSATGQAAQQLATQAAELPDTPPRAAQPGESRGLCVDLGSHGGRVSSSVRVTSAAAALADGLAPAGGAGVTPSCHPASLVAVRPGSGVLVTAEPAAGGTGVTPYLVTDNGVKYPIPSAGVVTQLGYRLSAAVSLPTTVLGLLPTGPSLDPRELAHGGIVAPAGSAPSCGT